MGKQNWLIVLFALGIGLTFSLHSPFAISASGKGHSAGSGRETDMTLTKTMKDSDIRQRQYMIEISRQLGVTCTYCHDLKDFKKDDKSAYKISKTHMDVVNMLNEKYSGKIGEKVDCFMCHRGEAKPKYKENLNSAGH